MSIASNVIILMKFSYYNLFSAYLHVCVNQIQISVVHFITHTDINQRHAQGMTYTQ